MSSEPPQSDADLLESVRGGNAAAYGELYKRHVAAARALARRLVRSEAEVEDVVAESFTKILDLVGRGGGPEEGFRPYLLTVVRRTVYDRTRVESRQVTTDEIEAFDPGVPFVDPALTGLERSIIAKAFLSLPDRWRMVLWHTEVENAKPAEVAPLLGLSANGVAALAYRAREGLCQAYLQMHLAGAPPQQCEPVLGKMGAYVRGGLARRDSKTVDDHVNDCVECRSVFLELADVNQGLRVIVGPLFVGPAFPAYLASLTKTAAVRGGGGSGILHALGWIRRAPKQQQAALAAATAVAAAAVIAVMMVSGEEPLVVQPDPSPALRPPQVALPSEQARPPSSPVATPERRTPRPVAKPVPPERPGRARLRASIDPLGSLVRAQPGIVGIRLRNDGGGASEELVAAVALPPGVMLVPGARSGSGSAPGRTVDGWSCRPGGDGATCARGPLAPGRATAVFLRVVVAAHAPEGAGPVVRVSSGGVSVKARAQAGVRASGAPARFATDGKVSVIAAGNTLLTCPDTRTGCGETRLREGTRRDNDLWPMQRLDRDETSTTDSSSATVLTLPKGGQVVWAGLYWSASMNTAGPIKFRTPGRKRYVMVKPDQVMRRELPTGPGYQAFADVTGLVSAGSRQEGLWWAADAPLGEGISQYAGWSLVVIATDPRQPYSQAVVIDTASVVGGERPRLTLPLDGLSPAATPARVELVTWEGDADLKGERVSLGEGTLAPSSGDLDAANVFDSSSNGASGLTFGMDVDTFHAELGEEPALELTSIRDVVLFGVAAVSVPARS
ncbi:sigma-70 family RNA polymerase sigma factor [Nonomuraea sp. NPDC046570]|uniref:sigma-70 family RNA polymerase sigma factor n=1 Tax=Nonomuraea sp. NPDC046570 TaxID=3155255 RepID=UPI0034041D56